MTTPHALLSDEEIEREFDSFFEFPSDDRSHVSSVSCRLFARHIAVLARASSSAVREERYRMLAQGDVIQASDEFLQDDGVTWICDPRGPDGLFVGARYSHSLKPARRALDSQQGQQEAQR